MAEGLPVERLRQYLRELKPEARALLIAELERGLLSDDGQPGAELVLQELRRSARETGRPAQRIGSLSRLFFQPLEPFLVDDVATHKHPGRIARVCLDPIWEWIRRDLVPGEAKAVSEEAGRAFADNDIIKAEYLARGFQDRVALRMQEALAGAGNDDKRQRRLAVQIGTARALEDVRLISNVLKARDALEAMGARIPGHIQNFTDGALDNAKALLESQLANDPQLFLYGLLLVMSRLAAPWQLIRLAVMAAGGDAAARIAETRYSVAVEIVLTEIERMVGELKSELRSGRGVAVAALLKTIHDAVRGVRTEIDLSVESNWARQLAQLRGDVSSLLKSEIESMPGRVRRLLRARPASEVRAGALLDLGDVAETETLIEFVGSCRNYGAELAISEMSQRAFSELQQYLEASTPALIEGLRQASEGERGFRQSQLDAAVRFCNKVFGQEYGSLLVKAGHVAIDGGRKAAKG